MYTCHKTTSPCFSTTWKIWYRLDLWKSSFQDVTIKIHLHNRNISINKLIKDKEETINQNDLWHAEKTIKKSIKNISSGSKKSEGVIWSEQLVDKTETFATHIHWAVRHCEKDKKKLQEIIGNIVPLYEHYYIKCHHQSRCKQDKKKCWTCQSSSYK